MSEVISPAQERRSEAVPECTPAGGTPRLHFVDGLRALAILMVLATHFVAHTGASLRLHLGPWRGDIFVPFRYGYVGVDLFLVLSGFCLYYPLVSSRQGLRRREPGLLEFARRRAWRILPPYYFSLALFSLWQVLKQRFQIHVSDIGAPPTMGSLLAHIFMVHTLRPEWYYGINMPYWSLSLEWFLYIGFPIFVVAFRKFGLWRPLVAVTALSLTFGMATLPLLSGDREFFNDFLFARWPEFVLGMIAARLIAEDGRAGRLRRYWGAAAATAFLVAACVTVEAGPARHFQSLFWGLAFFTLLLAASVPQGWVNRALSCRPMVWLGVISYSVYLTHNPLTHLLAAVTRRHMHSGLSAICVGLFLFLPLTLLTGHLFHLLFERPFMKPSSFRPPAPSHADDPAAVNAGPPRTAPRLRLEYLDGIRGLAALQVLFCHAYVAAIPYDSVPHALRHVYNLLIYPHYAVDMFIVLSGYCLMLPVARSADGQLQGGIGGYLRRRARRILPPYYAALGLSLALIAVMAACHLTGRNTLAEGQAAPLTAGGLVSHLLLVHNLAPETITWNRQIDLPMWSVAMEWQIYFVFALALLPVWRRWGSTAAVAAAFLATSVPYILFPHLDYLKSTCVWYVSLFALGMAAATVNFSPRPFFETLRARLPWRAMPILLALAAVVLFKLLAGGKRYWISDPCAGALMAAFLAYCTWSVVRHRAGALPGPLRLLQSRVAGWLGAFSYSLYLIHMPVLALMRALAPQTRFSPTVQFLAVIPLEILFCIPVAYGFHLLFEKRFMSGHTAPTPRRDVLPISVLPAAEAR